jgi:hypothetical protein
VDGIMGWRERWLFAGLFFGSVSACQRVPDEEDGDAASTGAQATSDADEHADTSGGTDGDAPAMERCWQWSGAGRLGTIAATSDGTLVAVGAARSSCSTPTAIR